MPDPIPVYQPPRMLGCFFGLIWLALVPVTVIFFAGGYFALERGHHAGEAPLRELGWWLIAGGGACTAILCCTIILNMRIRQLSKESWLEEHPDVGINTEQTEDDTSDNT